MKTVTTARMKAIDSEAICNLGISSLFLMENAARHVAEAVQEELSCTEEAHVLLVCGTGNNGGDGLACARLLTDAGISVTVLLAGNMEKCTPDAAANLRRLEEMGIEVIPYAGQILPECSCIVDALFGFGLNREVEGIYREIIEKMNDSPAPVIACDIPSGLSGDTGEALGCAVKAKKTVSFTCAKIGLTLPKAWEYVGQLSVVDIGIPSGLLDEL